MVHSYASIKNQPRGSDAPQEPFPQRRFPSQERSPAGALVRSGVPPPGHLARRSVSPRERCPPKVSSHREQLHRDPKRRARRWSTIRPARIMPPVITISTTPVAVALFTSPLCHVSHINSEIT